MRHLMFCISGFSGTGKDEVARRLTTAHGAVQTGLADPAKRHMADLYGFTEEQLFGPSQSRNAGDLRYPKEPWALKLRESQHHAGYQPEGLHGKLGRGIKYWECEGRNFPAEWSLPYVPLKLGSARVFVPQGDPRFWLSPREALQRYCELMNQMYLRSWSRKGVEVHKKLSEIHQQDKGEAFFLHSYSKMRGLVKNDLNDGTNWRPYDGTFISCFADFRHKHEIAEANDAETETLIPVLVRVRRPSVPVAPYQHRSETEQTEIPDEAFDYVVHNDGTLDDLYYKVDRILAEVKRPEWAKLRIVKGVMES